MSSPRILLYSHDGFGLGHLRRNLNVATRLVATLSDASGLLVAGFPGVPGVDLPDGVDLVKLPSIRKVATEQWRPRTLRIDDARIRELRRSLVSAAFRSFAPDLVLVDYMPAGVWRELVPSLRTLKASGHARIVLGLRDILDDPDVTRAAWARSAHGDILRECYDRILVYGDRDVFDADEAYGLSRFLPGRVEHVGYACTSPTGTEPAAIRARLGADVDDALVVVTAGGGADAFPMMSLVVRALGLLAPDRRMRVVVVAGPLMPLDEFHRIEDAAVGLSVVVRRTMGDLPDVLAAADLVVTMGAYNTLCEAVRLGRRVLSIPRRGPSAEQGLRARLFAERGLVEVAGDDEATADVAARMRGLLDAAPSPRRALDFSGLDRVTERLVAMLEEAHAGPRAPARTSSVGEALRGQHVR